MIGYSVIPNPLILQASRIFFLFLNKNKCCGSQAEFFEHPKTHVNINGQENIHNFMLKYCVYLDLCMSESFQDFS